MSQLNLFDDHEEELYLNMVWAKLITKRNLSETYHAKMGGYLMDAVEEGYDGNLAEFDFHTEQYKTLKSLRTNIYQFSAAKQYQQVRTMSAMISEESDYQAFKKKAEVVFKEYNVDYLKAEYNTAVGQSQMARDWVEAEAKADFLPMVTYQTQRDSHVRDEHAMLDGISLPLSHKFWNDYWPKNGWNCRCFVTQHSSETTKTNLKDRDLSGLNDEKKFPDLFKMNPGKDGIVYDPTKHPYFRVARGDAKLRANNFNLAAP